MRRFKFRPRTWIALGVVAVVAAAMSVAGYAYFIASGSGTGHANVGGVANIQIYSDNSGIPGGIWPDGNSHSFTVDVYNTGGGPQAVNQVTGTVESFYNYSDNKWCLGSWFSVAPVNVNNYVAVGDNFFSTTITMPLDNNDDQSGCAGQQLTIDWSSS